MVLRASPIARSSTALVNLVGWIVQESSLAFRRFQTGLVQNYALLMLFGIFAFVEHLSVRAMRSTLSVPTTFMNHYLSLILFTPLAGALAAAARQQAERERHPVDREHRRARRLRRSRCRCGSGTTRRAPSSSSSSALPWIPSIGAEYFLGVDGLSTLLILLTTMMGFIAILSSWNAITERVKEYDIFLLVLQTGMLGAFMALDFLLFFLFWEVMLVPMYFLIGIWGSANRLYSAIKFFLYTLVGSVVMLLGILALYFCVSHA